MDCLQLRIPPLPQFLTVGHSKWSPGMQHFERSFAVYDLLLVVSGRLYMMEEGTPYAIGEGELLLLEPGLTHVGQLPCQEETEIYWLHFKHEPAMRRLHVKDVPWSIRVKEGSDADLTPAEQHMFLPKFGAVPPVSLQVLRSLLDEMVDLRCRLTMGNAIRMQELLGSVLAQLQAGIYRSYAGGSRSQAVAEEVRTYLHLHRFEPYCAGRLAESLHLDEDYAGRCFRRHTGMSPAGYHRLLRMEEAKRLLVSGTLPLQAIAEAVGYSDYNYFIRVFKQSVGVSPGAYRRQYSGYI